MPFFRRTHATGTRETGNGPNGVLLSLGRAVLGGYFVYNGVRHFRNLDNYAAYASSKGVPMPKMAVAGTGALLLAGGTSLVTGVKPKLGTALIETFLLGVSPAMHAFWKEHADRRETEQVNFMKNMALVGAGLVAAAVPEPWPVSLARHPPATQRGEEAGSSSRSRMPS